VTDGQVWSEVWLRLLAAICDGTNKAGTNYFGRPLNLGKMTWIDVLFTPQFDLEASAETSELIKTVRLGSLRVKACGGCRVMRRSAWGRGVVAMWGRRG
jgi:hypothetical protein